VAASFSPGRTWSSWSERPVRVPPKLTYELGGRAGRVEASPSRDEAGRAGAVRLRAGGSDNGHRKPAKWAGLESRSGSRAWTRW
jgi:hypothetical protein